jgi:hypothetical protein
MTVESVTYISDLEPARPQGGDSIAQGDDHIRNIKKALKTTFKNIDGEVLANQDELNTLVDIDTSKPLKDQLQEGSTALQDQIDALDQRVTDNTANIATNTANIATNTADIATNAGNITTNTDSILALQTALNDLQQQVDSLPSGGSMIKAVQQPATAGDFSVKGSDQTYRAVVAVGNGITKTLTVPNGMVFCFEYLFGVGGGTLRVDLDEIYIDGVRFYPNNQGSVDYTNSGGAIWPGNDKSSIIRVEQSIELRGLNCYNANSNLYIAGIFTEA